MDKNFRLYWFPVISWAILIFVLSSMPAFPKKLEPLLVIDEIPHMIEYAIFAVLLARAFNNSSRVEFKKNFRILTVICVIVYGISDEWHQSFVPNRVACFSDIFYDTVGGIIGQFLYRNKKVS